MLRLYTQSKNRAMGQVHEILGSFLTHVDMDCVLKLYAEI
jgi:hypothetical protein